LKYEPELIEGRFVGRRKRFFADIEVNGEIVVAHCANTGSMRGLLFPGEKARIRDVASPKRKLQWSLEQLYVEGHWTMVQTARANGIVEEAIAAGMIPELACTSIRREVTYKKGTRFDLLLDDQVWVEVKNVSLFENGRARFPDSVTTRGQKHLRELAEIARSGARAAMVFHVSADRCDAVEAARDIDPAYADALRDAAGDGVELYAVASSCTAREVRPVRTLQVLAL